jgi:hypothetical protein
MHNALCIIAFSSSCHPYCNTFSHLLSSQKTELLELENICFGKEKIRSQSHNLLISLPEATSKNEKCVDDQE